MYANIMISLTNVDIENGSRKNTRNAFSLQVNNE